MTTYTLGDGVVDIDTLEGPALAEAVAVRVMGWWQGRSGICWYDTDSTDGKFKVGVVDYRPDLNIAQAWEVVSLFAGERFNHRAVIVGIVDEGDGWYCTIGGQDHERDEFDDFVDHTAYAPTAPLAICRAALKAIQPQERT